MCSATTCTMNINPELIAHDLNLMIEKLGYIPGWIEQLSALCRRLVVANAELKQAVDMGLVQRLTEALAQADSEIVRLRKEKVRVVIGKSYTFKGLIPGSPVMN